LRRWLLIAAGFLATGLGIIGIVVPVLPTTPFLLLAAACFIRSSDRFYQWLIKQKLLGSYIKNYREHRSITRRNKVIALVALWGVIGYTVVMALSLWWMRLLLLAIAVAVSQHILGMKTWVEQGSSQPDAASPGR
jgi:hypothetical protein